MSNLPYNGFYYGRRRGRPWLNAAVLAVLAGAALCSVWQLVPFAAFFIWTLR